MSSSRCLVRASRTCHVLLALAGWVIPAHAQPILKEPLSRVVQKVDNTQRAVLRGNTHPLATAANDRGPAPATMPASRLLLLLHRSAEQEARLQTYLRAVQDANSPLFHKWLSPAEFGRSFGVSDQDLAAVQQWLEQQGFTVNGVSSGRIAIEFSGTFAQVQSAFQTTLHKYVVNGEQHWANAADPTIPSALAPVVAGVVALHNFSPRSMAIRGRSGRYDPAAGRIRPQLTTGDTQDGYVLYMAPADAATVYDTPTSLNPAAVGTTYDGSGYTIGIAGDSNIDIQQNANYRATFGLPALPVQVVVDGADPGENGDAIEAYLDTEVAGGVAPGANVVLYTAADTYLSSGLFLAILRAVDGNAVDILNVSFGGCESAQGATGNQYIYDLWQQAAAQGISVTVSTGDSGAAGCDDQNSEFYAQYGLAVNGLGSTPYDIAVGGTDFDTLYSNFPTSFTTYVNTNNSLPDHRSALSYIPEAPWNDSTTKNGLLAGNVPWAATQDYNLQNIVASGGGASSCVTMNGTQCTAGYPVPTWQASMVTGTSGRNLPDVSFLAGNGLYGATWALCTDQDYISATQTQADCAGTPTTGTSFNVTGVGGTSAAAPAFAGMLALAAQKAGSRLGQADYVLYDLARSNYATVFHDIKTGNNSVPCSEATANCIAVNSVNTYYMSGFNTGVGYDEASGLGSVDATKMLNHWSGSGVTATTSALTLNSGTAAITLTHGTAVTAQVSVAGSGGTPSGPVALVDNLSPATLPDGGAIASFPLSSGSIDQTVNNLPGGSYAVTAHYGGDGGFAASDSNSIPVTVNPETSSTDLKVRGYYDPSTGATSTTPYYGFIYLLDAQPFGNSATLTSPNGVASGTITFTSGTATLGTAQLSSDGVAELQTAVIAGGTNSLKASFPGDPSFQSSTSSAVPLTVQPAASSLTMTTDAQVYSAGSPVTITATFANATGNLPLDSLGAAPTGTITFYADGTTKLGTATVAGSAGAVGSTITPASAAATYVANGLAEGSHTITATYSGNSNYAASTSLTSAPITILTAVTTLTLTPASTTIVQKQSLVITTTFSDASGVPLPTGTLNVQIVNNVTYMAVWASMAAPISNGVSIVTVPPNILPRGIFSLQVHYAGDSYYGSAFTTGSVEITGSGTVTPTLSLATPSAPVLGAVPITLTVSGPSGDPVPTGPVMYPQNNGLWQLVNGAVSFNASSTWNPGLNTITVTYLGDSTYAPATTSATFTEMSNALLNVSPFNSTIYSGDPLTLSISVAQEDSLPLPTGTVTASSGSYTSAATALAAGAASITIPANTLAAGTDTVTVTYSGDPYYVGGASGDPFNVTTAPAGFTIKGANLSIAAGATTGNSTSFSVTPANGFTGQVTLTAQVSSAPTGAVNQPTLSFGSTSPLAINAPSGGIATLTVTTMAPSTAMVSPEHGRGWFGISGTVFASSLLLIGSRRRRWQRWFALCALCLAILGGVSACGGGSGGSTGGGGGGSTGGTTPGIYTVTVTASSAQLTSNTTISVTVN